MGQTEPNAGGPLAARRLLSASDPERDHGAALWDFFVRFVAARRTFSAIYDRYERRVIGAARRLGVGREELVLPPQALFDLFNWKRLELLREARLRPLRELARKIFADRGDEDLLDVYCNHIYHEFSILAEEHRSVGRFLRIHDRRRYRQLFDEVSGYYPMRLRRVRRFFTGGLRRIELLLPDWARHRVIVRSVYLFGDRLALHAYRKTRSALYARMYPSGGSIRGYLEAGRDFMASGFMSCAREAAERGSQAAQRLRARRDLERAEQAAADAVEELLRRLDAEAGVPGPASELE